MFAKPLEMSAVSTAEHFNFYFLLIACFCEPKLQFNWTETEIYQMVEGEKYRKTSKGRAVDCGGRGGIKPKD